MELSQYDLISLVISSIFEFINERQHAIIEHEFEWLFNEAIKYKEGKNRKKLKGNLTFNGPGNSSYNLQIRFRNDSKIMTMEYVLLLRIIK